MATASTTPSGGNAVKQRPLDENNNNNSGKNHSEENQLNKYVIPKNYVCKELKCICNRERGIYECQQCHQFLRGRIGMICERHPRVVFLMDYRECPYCKAGPNCLQVSKYSWEFIRNMEDSQLPSDNDL